MSDPASADPPAATPASQPMKPGDEAPPGAPGSGENVCPVCHGSGKRGDAKCENCAGTGKVNTGIGGA
jgi:hypothetical protein